MAGLLQVRDTAMSIVHLGQRYPNKRETEAALRGKLDEGTVGAMKSGRIIRHWGETIGVMVMMGRFIRRRLHHHRRPACTDMRDGCGTRALCRAGVPRYR